MARVWTLSSTYLPLVNLEPLGDRVHAESTHPWTVMCDWRHSSPSCLAPKSENMQRNRRHDRAVMKTTHVPAFAWHQSCKDLSNDCELSFHCCRVFFFVSFSCCVVGFYRSGFNQKTVSVHDGTYEIGAISQGHTVLSNLGMADSTNNVRLSRFHKFPTTTPNPEEPNKNPQSFRRTQQ